MRRKQQERSQRFEEWLMMVEEGTPPGYLNTHSIPAAEQSRSFHASRLPNLHCLTAVSKRLHFEKFIWIVRKNGNDSVEIAVSFTLSDFEVKIKNKVTE